MCPLVLTDSNPKPVYIKEFEAQLTANLVLCRVYPGLIWAEPLAAGGAQTDNWSNGRLWQLPLNSNSTPGWPCIYPKLHYQFHQKIIFLSQ